MNWMSFFIGLVAGWFAIPFLLRSLAGRKTAAA